MHSGDAASLEFKKKTKEKRGEIESAAGLKGPRQPQLQMGEHPWANADQALFSAI